ncbi:TetR/AcrR family transcriptional regulator [Klenkia terrae]|uniref:TetR/AcrR family transcriptional regulator n=1 Tax=Klenkia terrae TaxID=1052259 RepID=A0ABU8E798_9ACTN|nr:TetR/AcrR family transcriptional regulator [Klenkia terrae]SSC23497.1 TetR family transcriptional regulator [Klenkia terrae]
MTTTGAGFRSTAEEQRERITVAALGVFADKGLHATPVADVATAAGVSPAYVFRLFAGKVGLFVAAVDRCYEQVAQVLSTAVRAGAAEDPAARLDAMTAAYVELIRDRSLIMIQVHAQSACDVPEVRDAVHRGLARVVETVTRDSGADPVAVQRFLAYGQLCHLVVQADLDPADGGWAQTITAGIAHAP